MDQEIKKEEVKEIIIGEFKPKRKFLSFVSSINGLKIRFIRDIAFVKGKALSGTLEGAIFKITICDEGTVNFEEVDTNFTDAAQRKRLLDDIDSTDVTGYAQKFVVSGIQFNDIDGGLCYLEVEHKKPIDVLRSIFDDKVEQKSEISKKGLSMLDDLFGSTDDFERLDLSDNSEKEVKEEVKEPIKKTSSYLEDSFRKMTEDKVIELKSRIEETTKEITTYKREISQTESKLKIAAESLGVLETRFESMSPGGESPNGFVFYVSEEQKNDTGLDESTKHIADKIADLLGLKKDVLFEKLTGGFYNIRIAKKDDISAEKIEIPKEILDKMKFDPIGKLTINELGKFEYRGDLTWHQIVGKMIRNGFEQLPTFDKLCKSNSYVSKEDKKECSHENCSCENHEGIVKDISEQSTDPLVSNMKIKKVPIDFDDVELKEILDGFEKENGFPVGDDFLFAIGSNDHNDSFYIQITPKSHFDANGYTYDGDLGFLKIPGHLDEVQEGMFTSPRSDVNCITDLINMGYKFSSKYQDFMEDGNVSSHIASKYSINGILLNDYITNNYPNSVV